MHLVLDGKDETKHTLLLSFKMKKEVMIYATKCMRETRKKLPSNREREYQMRERGREGGREQ